MRLSILISIAIAATCQTAAGQMFTCRYELPLAKERVFMRYVIDPIRCTFTKDSLHTTSPLRYDKSLPNGAFAYGNTNACIASIIGGCKEGFMANADIYDYFGWDRDLSTNAINPLNRRVPAGYPNNGIFVSFGPVIVQNSATTSVCWMVTGDNTTGKNPSNRILNCLTRNDTVNYFLLNRIRAETMPPRTGIIPRERTTPSAIRTSKDFDAAGRSAIEAPETFSPVFGVREE